MRWRDPRWLLALASLALVLALFALDWEQTSPGPLSAAHAAEPELQGAQGCDACHGDFGSSFDASCGACHTTVAEQVAAGDGLHGALDAADCELCHPEHHGAGLDLVGEAAFALAGFGARADFGHGHTEFALTGVHARLECAACHEHVDAERPPAGALRFGGLEQSCSACHDDPHAGSYGSSCADCHGQEQPFAELDGFVHERGMPLRGAHVGVACESCHVPGSERSVAALAGGGAVTLAPRACQDCHDSPHEDALLAGTAARASVAPAATCAVCHDEEEGRFDAGEAAMPRALHDLVGMQLDGPHVQLACASCHADGTARDPSRPARLGSDCAACHSDPHAGQFGADATCLDCHAREHFTPSRFDAAAHAAAGFALSGAHATTDCAACHAPAADAARVFRGTPTACAECHPNEHDGALAGAIAAPGADCAACHLPTAFAEVEREAFDHGRWTDFALTGAHDAATCEACHGSGAPERRLGRVAQRFAGSLELCASCHADVHRGAFAEDDCGACHTPHGFADAELRATFAHGSSTGFALVGAHARLGCAACHGEGLAAAPTVDALLAHARGFGFASEHARGDPATCAGCHADPHAGLFSERAALDPRDALESCAACHDAEAFAGSAAAGFDHGRWGGFALDGAHAQLECAACHAADAAPMPGMGALGVAAGRSCSACHDDPHAGQFARAGRTDCARCHDTAPGFAARGFNHDRDSRFALDERHADLACSACHVPWPVEGLGDVVRFKPLGTQCIDCHDHGGGGEE